MNFSRLTKPNLGLLCKGTIIMTMIQDMIWKLPQNMLWPRDMKWPKDMKWTKVMQWPKDINATLCYDMDQNYDYDTMIWPRV